MGTTKEWPVDCRDVAGRRRDMSVSAQEDGIVVSTPPGETAVFTPAAASRLCAALRAAATAAATTSADA